MKSNTFAGKGLRGTIPEVWPLSDSCMLAVHCTSEGGSWHNISVDDRNVPTAMIAPEAAGEHALKSTRHPMSLELMKLMPAKVMVGVVPSGASTGFMENTSTLL